MAVARDEWFPTCVWHYDVPAAPQLKEGLLRIVRDAQRANTHGMRERSSVLGWHSEMNLHLHQGFYPLMAVVCEHLMEVAQFLKWDLALVQPVLLNCWANVNGKYAYNVVHHHPHSQLSGAYYLQTNEKSGRIFFREPREVATMTAPPMTERTRWTQNAVEYEPREGRLLIFPSWLLHGVEPNLSDEDRIVVSFNCGAQPIAVPHQSPP